MKWALAFWLLILGSLLPLPAYSQDTTPPQLVDFDFSPTTIDIASGSGTVTFTAHITDDLAGVTEVRFQASPPTGSGSTRFCEHQPPISGDAFDGIYECDLLIPQLSELGQWTMGIQRLVDAVGNIDILSNIDLSTLGFPSTLVVQGGAGDSMPPELVEFDFSPTTIDIASGSGTVTFTAHITDDLAGVTEVRFQASPPTGLRRFCEHQPPVSGDELDGIYECNLVIPQLSELGQWTMGIQRLVDAVGNINVLSSTDLSTLGFPSTLVVQGGAGDSMPPELVEFDFSPTTIDITDGSGTVTFAARVTDDLAGATEVRFQATPPSSLPRYCNHQPPVTGNELDGVYECDLLISRFSEIGQWNMGIQRLIDAVGNAHFLGDTDLSTLGFPSTFDVVVADVFVSPAVLHFGEVPVGSAAEQMASISNVGDGTLVLLEVDFGEAPTSTFLVSSSPEAPTSIAPGDSVDIAVVFSPAIEGSENAILEITTNDPDQPVVDVLLEGTGVLADPTDQLADILTFFDQAVLDGTLVGSGPGASGDKRRMSLRNKLEASGDLLERGLTIKACNVLLDAFFRTDGVFPPPDFVEGVAAIELAGRIQTLRASLACDVQCGDVDREGNIDQGDIGRVRKYVARDKPDPPFELPRCSVKGGERDCDVLDVVLLRRELAGRSAPTEEVCQTKVLDLP